MPRLIERKRDGEQGSATTELVLLMPVMLLLVLLIVQFGLWLHARNVAVAAAQEGLLVAQVPDGTAERGRGRAASFLEETGGIRTVGVTVDRTVTRVRVEVTGTAPALLPIAGTWPVRGVADGPVERFIPEPER